MREPQFAVYVGRDSDDVHSGFIAHDSFFAVLEVEGELEGATVSASLKKLGAHLAGTTTLSSFENAILNWLKEVNLPTFTSIAAGLIVEDKIFLKTSGEGHVYLRRGRDFARLITGDRSASGHLDAGDYFIFATSRFTTLIGGEKGLSSLPFDQKPHDLVEEMAPDLKALEDSGAVALFLLISEKLSDEEEEEKIEEGAHAMVGQQIHERTSTLGQRVAEQRGIPEEAGTPSFHGEKRGQAPSQQGVIKTPDHSARLAIRDKASAFIGDLRERAREAYLLHGQKKVLTAAVVIIIFIVFLWSVVLSGVRRQQAVDQAKIQKTRELVTGYVEQASEVATLNVGRSQALLLEARLELARLKKELNGKSPREVAQLEALIANSEKEILKKEDKAEEEFYDLSVEKEGAIGNALYLDGGTLAILDTRGAIYLLSLDKKSLDVREDASMRGATRVARSEGDVYYLRPNSGVVKLPAEGKPSKVIEEDNWGEVVAMGIFNKNIYLLDRGRDQIYKYTPTEEGYSKKESYIKSGATDFSSATSIAIDGSVYVATHDKMVKYLGGEPEDFPAVFPQENISITKVFTSEEEDKVYAWDKAKGAIYVLGKSGVYERQISANVLSAASDMVVFEETAYILKGSKIYKVRVD